MFSASIPVMSLVLSTYLSERHKTLNTKSKLFFCNPLLKLSVYGYMFLLLFCEVTRNCSYLCFKKRLDARHSGTWDTIPKDYGVRSASYVKQNPEKGTWAGRAWKSSLNLEPLPCTSVGAPPLSDTAPWWWCWAVKLGPGNLSHVFSTFFPSLGYWKGTT